MLEPNNNVKYQNKEQDRRILFLEDKFTTINSEMGGVKIDVGNIKTDICWIKKSYWIVATASIGGLVGALINLIIK